MPPILSDKLLTNISFMVEPNTEILIVDDDPTLIKTLCNYLASSYKLSVAKTKSKAMELIKSGNYALVLLDVNLPDGNGLEICTEIKSSYAYADAISIILMTGEHSSEQEAIGLRLGAADYIYKPVNESVLKARVELQLDIQRRTFLLSQLAHIDALTEVGNRRAFDGQLDAELNRARREDKQVALAMLDIDYFKQYNDTYGHPAGDVCLRELAKCLKQSFKRHSDFCFRFGGEEFSVIMYDTSENEACRLMYNALVRYRELNIPHKNSLAADIVTFSAGVTADNAKSVNSQEIIKRADEALYLAKKSGRNKIVSTCSELV